MIIFLLNISITQEEFKDDKDISSGTAEPIPSQEVTASSGDTLESAVANLIDSLASMAEKSENGSVVNPDLMGLNLNEPAQSIGSFMPSQLLQVIHT